MNQSTTPDHAAIQRRIDRYLKEVDEVLKRGGASWRDRNSIRDNIQTQIREMLQERSQEAPTIGDAEAVIAKLDDPESYAPEVPVQSTSRENILRPIYLILSYFFLLIFTVITAQLVIMLLIKMSREGTGVGYSISAILIQLLFAALFLRIAWVCSKAAKKH